MRSKDKSVHCNVLVRPVLAALGFVFLAAQATALSVAEFDSLSDSETARASSMIVNGVFQAEFRDASPDVKACIAGLFQSDDDKLPLGIAQTRHEIRMARDGDPTQVTVESIVMKVMLKNCDPKAYADRLHLEFLQESRITGKKLAEEQRKATLRLEQTVTLRERFLRCSHELTDGTKVFIAAKGGPDRAWWWTYEDGRKVPRELWKDVRAPANEDPEDRCDELRR